MKMIKKTRGNMKKILFIVPAIAFLAGCQKEYQCTQQITKHVNGVEIDNQQIVMYSENNLDGTCFNYEQTINDTVTVSKTTCE